MTRWPPLAAAAALAAVGVTAVLAQTVEDLDIAAIKSRASEQAGDAAALAAEVAKRGDAFRADAADIRQRSELSLRRFAAASRSAKPAGPIDFDAMIAAAGTAAAGDRGAAPQLLVFASLSMPPASLRPLIADTARAGGVVVFRGFPNNSVKAFSGALARVVGDEHALANVGIDPRLFRAFAIAAVPTVVSVSSDFDLCDGFDCRTVVPPHDRIAGNVTLEHALATFAEGGGPGARVAAVGLAQLRRDQQ